MARSSTWTPAPPSPQCPSGRSRTRGGWLLTGKLLYNWQNQSWHLVVVLAAASISQPARLSHEWTRGGGHHDQVLGVTTWQVGVPNVHATCMSLQVRPLFASKARAQTAAAMGADADVPVCSDVQILSGLNRASCAAFSYICSFLSLFSNFKPHFHLIDSCDALVVARCA